jgi:DNA invertase Pin-like site-specific DNA recombinase
MRFAIWTAVSTLAQAADEKDSLAEQERKCRQVATGKGWKETAGPFIIPGESRTRWVNLRDAEMEIPVLRQMLESAKAGNFDILILWDYNRLRDLLDPVAKTLAAYGVQIYSANQPVDPLPPEEFNPYASDSASMMQGMSQIISRWQNSDLRRKYLFGIPSRVRKGLYGLKIPYGYMKPPGRENDKNVVPIPHPVQSRVVIEIKDMFIAGISYRRIQDHLNAMQYPTATGVPWARTTIIKMLQNPFYAGKVFFGRNKTLRDPRFGTIKVIRNRTPMLADGKQEPLYSWTDYEKIRLQFEHRGRFDFSHAYPFTGLLVCSVCGGKVRHRNDYWQCKSNLCVKIRHLKALEIIPPRIQDALQSAELNPEPPPDPADTSAQIQELERQRKRVQQLAEREIYSPDEAQDRMKAIRAKMEEIQDSNNQHLRENVERELFYSSLSTLRGLRIAECIRDDDPETVNPILQILISRIIISPEYDITVCLKIDGSS